MKNKKLIYILIAVAVLGLIWSGPDMWRMYITPLLPSSGAPRTETENTGYASQRQMMNGNSSASGAGENKFLAASAPAGTIAVSGAVAVKTGRVARVKFNPSTKRDPTVSPDERAAAEKREREAEAARKKAEAEAAERERLARLRAQNPAWEVQGKIRLEGILHREVLINGRAYGVGQSVLGARITAVRANEVVFIYKGQTFTKKLQ